jgi:hypothetical protein
MWKFKHVILKDDSSLDIHQKFLNIENISGKIRNPLKKGLASFSRIPFWNM